MLGNIKWGDGPLSQKKCWRAGAMKSCQTEQQHMWPEHTADNSSKESDIPHLLRIRDLRNRRCKVYNGNKGKQLEKIIIHKSSPPPKSPLISLAAKLPVPSSHCSSGIAIGVT